MLSSSGLNIDYIKKRSYDDKFIFVFLLKGRDITKLFIAADKNCILHALFKHIFLGINYLLEYYLNESIMLR